VWGGFLLHARKVMASVSFFCFLETFLSGPTLAALGVDRIDALLDDKEGRP